ncbi:OmpA family protein [Rickettsiales endosymbiont of Stachyamoeba lipophora]|uniref:OmpA family protein n=1 Tax=Rickettsiales endosymbiont of Stachyamoeba lipophora TaxID=2486578 RepID=UPI000F6519FB|nr:OmpA family protein [Rickettsiales endosymbiont of Stachyamoeba lipophora]AZL16416.1 OmpA family protein [Rickettsiales endosymbiont of Stachyamoeba lipophora]
MKKKWLTLPLLVAVTACNNFHHLKTSHIGDRDRGDFNSSLSSQYRKMANEEARIFNWIDAERFAKKAVDAAHYREVTPDNPAYRWLTPELKATFQEYRNEILWLDTPHNRKNHPRALAALISSYDNLLDEQAEGNDIESILTKRDAFIKNARYFFGHNHLLGHHHFTHLAHNDIVHSETLYFNNNSSYVSKLGKTILMRALNKAMHENMGLSKIVISAHADKVGSDAANHRLALERAAHIKEALMELGVHEHNIEILNYGEEKPIKHTKGSSAKNRRVEIDFVR